MKLGLTSLFLLHLCLQSVAGQNLEFYVSVDGSDSWDGTSDTNVDGSDVGPWLTLNHAMEELRQIRDLPYMTSAKFWDFFTPSALPHLGLIYSTKFMQPPLLHLLLG